MVTELSRHSRGHEMVASGFCGPKIIWTARNFNFLNYFLTSKKEVLSKTEVITFQH